MITVRSTDLITVGRTYGMADTALAVAMLNAYGIKVLPDSWHTLSVQWQWAHALGGVELRVPVSMVGDALEILADFQAEPRPKNPARRLFITLVVLTVLVLTNVPPPATGFYASGLRRVPAGAATPLTEST